MGRPLIGKRASCFLSEESHEWLEDLKKELNVNTKAQVMRTIIEASQNREDIVDVLKAQLKE